jgi:hypothetical protein
MSGKWNSFLIGELTDPSFDYCAHKLSIFYAMAEIISAKELSFRSSKVPSYLT